jgi:hypothetical protein
MINLARRLHCTLHQCGIADIANGDFQTIWIGTFPAKPVHILVNSAPRKVIEEMYARICGL